MEKLHGKYFVTAAVFFMVVSFTSAANLGQSCTGGGAGDCTAPNAVCDTNCVCKDSYKNNADDTACIKRALGDTCTASTDSDCDGVEHAVCKTTDNVCACVGAYKQSGDACVAKAYGDSCADNADCAGDANSECSAAAPKTCVCKTDFTAINNVCNKALGDTCSVDGDCTAGVADSKCSTATPKKCECASDFTAINNLCKKGIGNTCTDNNSCSAVSNAECVGTPLKCACKANYKEDNGQCSTANGLQSLLSAPVALLLSFLTIVVTKLH